MLLIKLNIFVINFIYKINTADYPGSAHWKSRMNAMKETMLFRDTVPSPSPEECVSKTVSVTEIREVWGSWKPS